uniref:autophagy-related protein 16-1-like n=1 Tax=Myxine glutinosa TaxID=7769 RepID=UPI00358EC5A4
MFSDGMARRGLDRGASWKEQIWMSLVERDRVEKECFQDLIISYNRLLEKSDFQSMLAERLQKEKCDLQNNIVPGELSDGMKVHETAVLRMKHQQELTELHKLRGELAQNVITLNSKLTEKEKELQEVLSRVEHGKKHEALLQAEVQCLRAELAELHNANQTLKDEYEALQMACTALEEKLRRTEEENRELIARWMAEKSHEADLMNSENDKDTRKRQAKLKKELADAAQEPVNVEIEDDIEVLQEDASEAVGEGRADKVLGTARGQRHLPGTLSAAQGQGLLDSISSMFRKRVSSHGSLGDMPPPTGFCVTARLPEKAIYKFDAHDGEVNAARFHQSSRLLVTGGTDRKVKLWDMLAGKCECRGPLTGSNAGITSLDFDITGSFVLAASSDFASRIWGIEDFRLRHTLTGHSGKVLSAKFMPDGMRVVSGSHDRTLKLWDLRSRACTRTIFAGSSCNDVVCTEQCVISGHFDKKIRFWDTRAESTRAELKFAGRVTSLCISPDGSDLLSCSRDDVLHITDLRTMKAKLSLTADGFKCGADWTRAVYSPDGQYIAAGSADGTLYVWNAESEKLELMQGKQHSAAIHAVCWSPNGDCLVSVDKACRAVIWSAF